MSTLLSNCTLLDRNGHSIDKTAVIARPEKIALYFSAHFCAPCRQFTPALKEFYDEVNEDEKKLEIIFVSLDKTEEEAESYHREHGNWPRVSYDDEDVRMQLKEKLGVEKIPALIVLDNEKENAKFTDGVNDVKNMGPMAFDMKWGN